MISLVADYGQEGMVSTKAALHETLVDGQDDYEEERTYFLRYSISVDIFYAFLGYEPLSGSDNIVVGSIMHL